MRNYSLSLRLKLPLLVLSTFALLWATATWHEYQDRSEILLSSSLKLINWDMSSLQREMEKEIHADRYGDAGQALLSRGVNAHYQSLVATDDTGKILFATQRRLIGLQATDVLPDFNRHQFTKLQNNNRPQSVVKDNSALLTSYYPLSLARKANEIRPSRIGALYLAYDLSVDKAKLVNDIWHASIDRGIQLLLLLLVMIILLSYFITRPIQLMVKATQDLTTKGFTQHKVSGSGELEQLADAFNNMSKQLKQRFEQLQLTELTLQESNQQQRQILNNTSSLVFLKGLDGRYLFSNDPFKKLFHSSIHPIKGKTDHELYPKETADIFRSNDLKAQQSDSPLSVEEVIQLNDGKHTYLSIKFPLKNAQGKAYAICGIATDITERKYQEEQILRQAHFDTLTNLPNRFLALDRLTQLLKDTRNKNELFAVLFLDLDDFKKINDSMGHETGDLLLIEAAERLTKSVRKADTVARLGGDEFIVLLPGLKNVTDTRPIVDNLLKQFRKPFNINNRELILTTSIGIALYPADGKNSSELLRNADSAMYHAKDLGRNAYSYFTESMNHMVSRRLELEEQIHGSLERGEFDVVYQPQIDINSGHIIGAEALLRWSNPALGNVPPDEFISIAEQSGLIIPIGQFVLKQALSVQARWQQHSQSDLRMAVNISPRQFRDPDLFGYIEQAIQESGVAATSVELEITEGVLMSGHTYIDDTLAKLSKLGVSLALDDFGTGYSSLSYLRKYPFDVLKIDRSFVNDITLDIADKELVNASIVMAHALGLTVVAEGVETQEQLTILRQLGSDFAQGYLFSKPISSQALFELQINEKQAC